MRVSPRVAVPLAGLALRALTAGWSYRLHGAGEDEGGSPGSGVGEEGVSGRSSRRGRTILAARRVRPAVYVLWHEQILPLSVLHRDQGVVALVSRHRDGEILAGILERLGFGTVRGSSTRGGGEAFRTLVRAGRRGRALAVTPDGPRGPARRCKPGAIRLAALTGLPIVPLAAAASRSTRVRSWDRMLLPHPFSTIHVWVGEALSVPARPDGAGRPDGKGGGAPVRDGDGADLTDWALRVTRALEEGRRRCEAAARREERKGRS